MLRIDKDGKPIMFEPEWNSYYGPNEPLHVGLLNYPDECQCKMCKADRDDWQTHLDDGSENCPCKLCEYERKKSKDTT